MELNKLVLGALALGCLGAAAGGGYLAARQNAAPVVEAVAAPTTDLAPSAAAAQPVAESEGVIAPEAPTPAPPPVTVAPVRETRTAPAARRRVDPPAPQREEPRRAPSQPARSEPPA